VDGRTWNGRASPIMMRAVRSITRLPPVPSGRAVAALAVRAIVRLAVACCAGLTLHAEQLPLKVYTTADGLARDQVNRIVRDSRGFLWFCTAEGLSRFDSHTFVTYGKAQGLPGGSVRDLLETRSGTYWVATSQGICRLDVTGAAQGRHGSVCTAFNPGETAGARNVFRLVEDRAGAIWVGTFEGVFRLDASADRVMLRAIDFGMPEGQDHRLVQDILEDRRGSLWVATRGSALYRRLPNGHVDHYGAEEGLPPRINALAEDRGGVLWAATAINGLCRLAAEPRPHMPIVSASYSVRDALPSNWMTRLLISSDGTLWAGSSRGLTECTLDADSMTPRCRSFNTVNGLSDYEVSALAEDRDRNVWVGTPAHGAMRLARNGFTTFGATDGLGRPVVGSIFEGQSGDLFLFGDGVLSRFNGRRFDAIRPNFPENVTNFSWGASQTAVQGRSGDWWFAAENWNDATNRGSGGLVRFSSVGRVEDLTRARPRVYTRKDGLPGDDVLHLFEDSRGDVWLGVHSDAFLHLVRWSRATDTFTEISDAQGWPADTWVNVFLEDASGTLWIGTGGKGLARYQNGRFTFLTQRDGLRSLEISALYRDRLGRLWITGGTDGVDVIDDPAARAPMVRHYSTKDGLSSDTTLAVTEDSWGRIYVTTGRGVDRLDPASGRFKHYTSADGLIRGEATLAFRDRHGALWFGGNYEISRLIPVQDPPESPPPALIGGLRIGGVQQAVPLLGATELATLTLPPSQNHLDIDFFGLMFRPGETLRYQYRLEGSDRDWSEPTDRRTVSYASLAPGHYRFMVRAVSAGGVSDRPAGFTFTVLPPIWMRWWFMTLAASALGAAVHLVYRYRVAQLLAVERVRMRIATDLHDDIGASLSRVAILSEVLKQQMANAPAASLSMLTDIGESVRGIIGSVGHVIWAIDPRNDDVDAVLVRVRQFASAVLDAKGIDWRFDAPPGLQRVGLGPDARRHIFLFFKEGLNNVVRHAECRSVVLSAAVEGGHIVCRIRDDGRGVTGARDPTSLDGGRGLAGMRARAAQLGGRFTIEAAASAGTQLTLTVPLRKRVSRRGLFARV
jgi:ligand-binding sensor domain-containing protein/signal transduction histidine kinase